MIERDDQSLSRPFYFIVVLWGERFRDYFLEYCVPSLLAPGNLPSLRTRQPSKFLIATRPEDWAAMAATPIFRLLERYVTPVYIEIPPCPPDKSGCEHMGIGHKRACEMAFRDKAYATVVTPDSVLSDGSVARLQEHARAGVELVLSAATLRIAEEGFFANLEKMGLIGERNRRDTAAPLVITGGQMTKAAINSLHSQGLAYEWNAPYFCSRLGIVPAAWWRVPGEDGLIVHCLAWAPLLVDYNAVRDHDTSSLDTWTLDGDYIFQNIGHSAAIHVVTDSDEMFLASWSPSQDRPVNLTVYRSLLGALGKGAWFRSMFEGPTFDPMKRRLFFTPVRWHSRPLNAAWDATEAGASQTLRKYVRPPGEAPSSATWRAWVLFLRFVAAYAWLGHLFEYAPLWWSLNHRRVKLALKGDRAALTWVWYTVRKLFAVVIGRAFHDPKPTVPGA